MNQSAFWEMCPFDLSLTVKGIDLFIFQASLNTKLMCMNVHLNVFWLLKLFLFLRSVKL